MVIEGVASWIAGTSAWADEAPARHFFIALLPLIFGVARVGLPFTQDKCGRLWALFGPQVSLNTIEYNWASDAGTLLGCSSRRCWRVAGTAQPASRGRVQTQPGVSHESATTPVLVLGP